jgi:multiple sugar transport system substrate-binding protein
MSARATRATCTTRRRALALGTALAPGGAAFSATGCAVAATGGSGAEVAPPAPQGGPPAEVVFMRPANASLSAAYDAQAEAFNRKQFALRARFEAASLGQGEAWPAKLTSMLAADSAPDCFLVEQANIALFASSGRLLVLDPYLRRDAKEVNPDDVFPAHLAGGKWQGKQVALTPDGCALLDYYNVTLFQEAGVPPPRPTWTWTDYLDAARRLTKKDGAGQVVQAGAQPVNGNNQFWLWLWSNGSDLFSPDFKQVRLTEPAALEAMQLVVDLILRHGVAPTSPGTSLGANPDVQGKLAMWRANRGFFGNLQTVTSFKFNVVPVPRSTRAGLSTTVTTPGHIAIARNHRRPDAAWGWHKYLTGTEAQVIRSKVQQGGCPSRKSATQDASYADLTLPALESTSANQAFADVLADPKMARFIPQYVGMDEAMGIVSKYLTAAAAGEQSVPAAMESAKREVEDLLRRQPQPA